ncbi:uncharacterized protein LOC133886194 [Phragmites australis]|uniref:uncharacterized protein LOC133886194 n=1 Tax=Phragmites australis TaxID=29695 RepID=UPI002D7A057B|nr:uncharacterized protein LOC133886194 [Phragmites australis]
MEKSRKPKSNLASHRRFEQMDMNKSSTSLNMSTSSLRIVREEIRKDDGAVVQGSRRATTVRFAAPPPPSSSLAASTKMHPRSVSQHQAMARPATASGGARPGSASGPRGRTSAGRLPESGPKVTRRSWGCTGGVDAKEQGSGDPVAVKIVAKTQARSSSVPRRLAPEEKDKPLPRTGSKIMTTSRMKANADSPPKPDMEGSRSPPNVATKAGDHKAPNSVSLNNMVKATPTGRTSVTTIGASWESLPTDLQSLGLEVMNHRDAAEAAAVEAMQEASAAEILLRCLSAFADLTSAAAEQSPQQTVDMFLVLHAAITSSTVAGNCDDKEHRHAADWLRAAVSTDLGPFSLYTPMRKFSRTASPAASLSPPSIRRAVPAGEAGVEVTWLDEVRRGLGEEMRAWFIGHVERLLDADVAGTLGQLKRVNDWLDDVGVGSESEAVERVRKKIYGYLLDHVESAVVALNGGVAPGRRK